MIIIMMSLWMMFPLGACSTMNGDAETPTLIRSGLWETLDETDIYQCLSLIRPHENAEHYYRRGRYLQDRNKHRLAIQEFKSAIAVNHYYTEAYNALGISSDIMGDYSAAVGAYKGALMQEPKRDDILNNLGYSYMLQKQYDKAIQFFAAAVAIDADNVRYQNNLGLACAESGQFGPALQAFRKTTDAADAHVKLAGILRRNGYDKAADEHLYLASSLREGRQETDKLLEQPVISASAAAIVEENITEDRIYDGAVAPVEKENSKKTVKNTSAVFGTRSLLIDESDDEPESDSDITVIPKKVEKKDLTASLETDALPESIAPEKITPASTSESEIPERQSPPQAGKDTSEILPKEQGVDEPFPEFVKESEMIPTPAEEPEEEKIAPRTSLEMMFLPALNSKDNARQTVAEKETKAPEASNAAMGSKADMTVAEENHTMISTVPVEIVSRQELQSIARNIVEQLDKNRFSVVAGETAIGTDTRLPEETVVYYCEGYLQEAWAVAKTIPGWQAMKKVQSLTPSELKIRAVLCGDLMPKSISIASKNQPKEQL